jgi:hypothetical protein
MNAVLLTSLIWILAAVGLKHIIVVDSIFRLSVLLMPQISYPYAITETTTTFINFNLVSIIFCLSYDLIVTRLGLCWNILS